MSESTPIVNLTIDSDYIQKYRGIGMYLRYCYIAGHAREDLVNLGFNSETVKAEYNFMKRRGYTFGCNVWPSSLPKRLMSNGKSNKKGVKFKTKIITLYQLAEQFCKLHNIPVEYSTKISSFYTYVREHKKVKEVTPLYKENDKVKTLKGLDLIIKSKGLKEGDSIIYTVQDTYGNMFTISEQLITI